MRGVPPRLRVFARLEIEIPIGEPTEERQHIEVRLSPLQSRGLAALTSGLDAAGAALSSGDRPLSAADAVRWLLEQVGAVVTETCEPPEQENEG